MPGTAGCPALPVFCAAAGRNSPTSEALSLGDGDDLPSLPACSPSSSMGPLRLLMILNVIRKLRSALAVRSTRDTTAYITRLTATATFAYLLATLIPGTTDRPVLAPLTALLVRQASLSQTIRSGLKKVLSVAAGVLLAVVLAEFIGFSWWQLMLVIAVALLIGGVLRLGDDLLEVPISAMLIFASAGHGVAAAGRVVDTLVGTVAGLLGGLVFASLRV